MSCSSEAPPRPAHRPRRGSSPGPAAAARCGLRRLVDQWLRSSCTWWSRQPGW